MSERGRRVGRRLIEELMRVLIVRIDRVRVCLSGRCLSYPDSTLSAAT